MSTVSERINESLGQVSAQLSLFSATLSKLDEVINGTSKSGGLKERIAVAEKEIERNKQSFEKINAGIVDLRNEMITEIGNVAKSVKESRPPGINWNSVLQAVITAIAVGVTGIIFWQIVLLLAENSPLKP